jgi:hypothetical protein
MRSEDAEENAFRRSDDSISPLKKNKLFL